VELHVLDTSSPASIRAFVRGLGDGLVLDGLLNSAAIRDMRSPRRETPEGFELTWATNVLGPFLLTRELLPALERAAPSRIVNVTSELHDAVPGQGPAARFDFDDPQLARGYDGAMAYKNTKLALLWFTYELARRLPPTRITVNAPAPGWVPTTLAEHETGFQRFLLRHVMARLPFANSVDVASGVFVSALTDPALDSVTGRYLPSGKEGRSSEASYDVASAQRFWKLACDQLGIADWP
jgi:NAD(P)-dependent dehydrogenase (short-subunit alcohol dehydrogenase family)